MMRIPKDWKEFIELLNSNEVDYIVVGSYAMAYHGVPRLTQDIDFFVRSSIENGQRLEQMLKDFGFGSLGITAEEFAIPSRILQLGREPNRIDLLTSIDGVDFEEAWKSRVEGELDGLRVWFLERSLLIQNKRSAGRLKDISDAELLEQIG